MPANEDRLMIAALDFLHRSMSFGRRARVSWLCGAVLTVMSSMIWCRGISWKYSDVGLKERPTLFTRIAMSSSAIALKIWFVRFTSLFRDYEKSAMTMRNFRSGKREVNSETTF